jgi:hypothetical protein
MHDKRIEPGDPGTDDRSLQAAVLEHVLWLYPQSLTLAELICELTGGTPDDFRQRDGITRAVGDLAGVGLLRGVSELVLPTRAAVAFHVIREEG